jgi:formamidopyrimidine-DNA glycosylase
MPELPEVETMRRGLLKLVGRRISRVERPDCSRKPIAISPNLPTLSSRISGCCVTAIERLGKRIVLRLDQSWALVIEPRMTGLVLLEAPPTVEHLRLRVLFASRPKRELLFWDRRGLGTVTLYSPRQLSTDLYPRLGFDALSITLDELRASLGTSRRPIKVALLDQRSLAGIGNLYASEILFVAAIDPRVRCSALTKGQWARIHRAMRMVLEEAIRYEGSTLSDGTYRNALNQTGSYQNHHRVYDLAGSLCQLCRKSNIRRIVQAQRSTFFCAHCQSRRSVKSATCDLTINAP